MTTPEIILDEAAFEALLDYSCSIPTGVIPGKQWKRRVPYHTGPNITNTWYLGEYGEADDEDIVPITWRRIMRRVPRSPGHVETLAVKMGLILPRTYELLR